MSSTPKYPSGGVVPTGTVATANTALDGTGSVLTLTPGVACRAKGLIIRHLGTNIQTVLRAFINNGSTNGTASNNGLITERTILANTLSQTAESIGYFVPFGLDGGGIILPSAYRVLVTVGTTIAAGLQVTLEAEDLT